MAELPAIAIIGGTGLMGRGLAGRWVRAGYAVILGSRDESKAVAAAKSFTNARGASNVEAARDGEIVVLTVPFDRHSAALESISKELRGKILVDVTVPLVPPKIGT